MYYTEKVIDKDSVVKKITIKSRFNNFEGSPVIFSTFNTLEKTTKIYLGSTKYDPLCKFYSVELDVNNKKISEKKYYSTLSVLNEYNINNFNYEFNKEKRDASLLGVDEELVGEVCCIAYSNPKDEKDVYFFCDSQDKLNKITFKYKLKPSSFEKSLYMPLPIPRARGSYNDSLLYSLKLNRDNKVVDIKTHIYERTYAGN